MEEIEYKKCKIKVIQDEYTESPREWENTGTMICFHKRYSLGDSHDLKSEDYCSWQEVKEEIEKMYQPFMILPLYLYDHSGITISTSPFSCRWDSGQVGFIFVTEQKIKEEFIETAEKDLEKRVRDILNAEVETFDKYIRGEVYGYVAEDHEGNSIDSCSGYYDCDDMIKEAQYSIDCYLEDIEKTIGKMVIY